MTATTDASVGAFAHVSAGSGMASPAAPPTATTVVPPATGGRSGASVAITFDADLADLDRLALRHAGLTALTFGLYAFWAKVEWRQRLWQAIRIDGVALRYTGSVRELLRPALFLLGGLVVFAIAIMIAKYFAVPRPKFTPSPWRLLVTLPLVYVIGLSIWGARDYLLTRTSMDGVAGALLGNRHHYAALHFATALMMGPTMGFALPWRQAWLQRRLVEGMHLGSHRFTFNPAPAQLTKRWTVVWATGIATYLGVVLTLAFSSIGAKIATMHYTGKLPTLDRAEVGLCVGLAAVAIIMFTLIAAWYRAGVLRQFVAATAIDGRKMQIDLPTGEFVRMAVAHKITKMLSLGLLAPMCEARELWYLIGRLSVR